ncbi:hypothetical protein E2C01_043624 [Portunus trituberculatus]|uniref:Uncharacterized protein n=1 Tax=Portunus trituberculatus TaxID=210409 RepID=A0A5B7FPZ0_PORTR|nr:hypothetical protein [Portunus trituberculatus]
MRCRARVMARQEDREQRCTSQIFISPPPPPHTTPTKDPSPTAVSVKLTFATSGADLRDSSSV